MECNLTALECDELEFEGPRPASQLGLLQAEVVLAAALVGLTALIYAWSRVGPLLGGARARLRRQQRPAAASPATGPSPHHQHQHQQQQHGTSLSALDTAAPRMAATPGTGGRAEQPGLRPCSPPLGSIPAASRSPPTFSISPGLCRTAREGSTSLLRAPSGLLRHLSALGQQLRLPRRSSPLWALLTGGSGRALQQLVSPRTSPGARYGLGLGEAESADEQESDDDLTARELRALHQSPEFAVYMRGRGLTREDVARSATKLRLYCRLRQLDPSGFWLLCRADTTRTFETQEPTAAALVSEYFLNLWANMAAAASLYCACTAQAAAAQAACLTAAWWLTVAAWAQGRSRGGTLLDMWYEELRWGHSPPFWRVVAANLLELVYVVGTAGVGAVVSLALRCRGGRGGRRRRGQGVGEMCAGVRQVREVVETAVQPPSS